MLLTLGFAVLALVLVLVVVAATQVHVQRMRLARVADEIALDAADALDVEAYYEGTGEAGEPGVVPLAGTALEAVATDRVAAAADRAGLPPTVLVDASATDGRTATVTVATVVHPLFGIDALLPFADGIELTATSSARGS